MKKLSDVVWDVEKPSKSCPLFVSVSLPNGISLKMTSGYIALIVVLSDEYETVDYRMENNMKMAKISSTESAIKKNIIN